METGTAIAIGVGALVLVFVLTRHQEQGIAAMIAAQKQQQPSGPYALSFGDLFAVGGTAAAYYFGGAQSAAKVLPALAR